jgi:ribosomal protein S16
MTFTLRSSCLPQNLPFYRLFVADSRAPRDGRHVDIVGHYDPIPGALAQHSAVLPASNRQDHFCPDDVAYEPGMLVHAGKDGNKQLGIDIERIKCEHSSCAVPSHPLSLLRLKAAVCAKRRSSLPWSECRSHNATER